MSHQAKGRSQPSAAQVSWRTDNARRWAVECSRRSRPRSRGTDRPPSTAGRMPASQARRRASPTEILVPVSRRAAARPSTSRRWSTCTSSVTALRWKPPSLPSGLVGRCSISSVRPRPSCSLQDSRSPVVTVSSCTTSPAAFRASLRGEVSRSRAARSMCPWSSGITNLPDQVPSPLSPSVSQVSISARRSSLSSWRPRAGRPAPRTPRRASAGRPAATGGRPSR